LLSRDRFAEARAAAACQLGVPVESLPMPTTKPVPPPKTRLIDLLSNPRAFWLIAITWLGMSATTYGYQLWAPTILALTLHLPVPAVAGYFIIVGIAGFVGRFVFSALPVWIGRRHSGEIMGWGAALLIFAAAYFRSELWAGMPAFIVCLAGAAIFVNGGFANMAPFAAESYPVRLAARASGWAQGVNGIGKMLGPVTLALIAGTDNLVTPQATEGAVMPAFSFLAACSLLAGLAYSFLPIETHGRALSLKGEKMADSNGRPSTPRSIA
jgi:putative MFS transporter